MTSSWRLALAGLALASALPIATWAQEPPGIASARNSGLIGERYDGYLGVVGALSPGQRSQVAAINIKRRSLYSDLAAKRAVSPQEVAVTVACQLLQRVEVGQYYLLSDGRWQRRDAGEAAPQPAYCAAAKLAR